MKSAYPIHFPYENHSDSSFVTYEDTLSLMGQNWLTGMVSIRNFSKISQNFTCKIISNVDKWTGCDLRNRK
jgi:hypothetical protein